MFKCHLILSEKPLLCTLTDKFTALLHVISLRKLQAWGDVTHSHSTGTQSVRPDVCRPGWWSELDL